MYDMYFRISEVVWQCDLSKSCGKIIKVQHIESYSIQHLYFQSYSYKPAL